MAIGRKTGGRAAGTPNRKTEEVSQLLASLGCDPIRGMAEIACNPEASLELRGRMHAELAQYIYPKRKAVEHQFPGSNSVTVTIEMAGSRLPEPGGRLIDGVAETAWGCN